MVSCRESLSYIWRKKEEYEKAMASCKLPPLSADPNQSNLEAFEKIIETDNSAIAIVDDLRNKNKALREELASRSLKDFGALYSLAGSPNKVLPPKSPTPGKSQLSETSQRWQLAMRQGANDQDLAQKISPRETDSVSKQEPKAFGHVLAIRNRTDFISSLISQDKDLANYKLSLENHKQKAEVAKNSLGPGTDTGGNDGGANGNGDGNSTGSTADQKSPGSGFDPSSLMGLAGPLMGLLAPKPKAPESGLSSPAASSTPPLPQTPSARLNSGENKKPANGGFSLTPEEKKPATHAGGESTGSNSYGGYEAPQSDVSTKNSGGSSSSPLGVSSSGGLGGSGSGGNKEEEKREPAAAPLMAKGDEGFPGGGGDGGYGGGGSHASEEAPTEHESPMKEVLNDMETAIDGGTPSWGSEEGQAAEAEPGVATEDSGSLFPRVSACYARSLKKGLVLNGLGEKIEE